MIALLGSVIVASGVGSLHCAAMCGPLTSLYLEPGAAGTAPRTRWLPTVMYSVGRLGAYVSLGVIAGGVGSVIELAGRAASIQRAAMIVAAAAILAWGALSLAAALGLPVPSLAPRTWNRGLIRIRRRRPVARAALVGLLSAALPCGWLWAFVMIAAGTGGMLAGAAVMTAFWLGTLPMMMGIGVIAMPLVRRLGARLPLVTSLTLILLGVVALAARTPMLGAVPVAGEPGAIPTAAACHGDPGP